jgi:hypothetical protein
MLENCDSSALESLKEKEQHSDIIERRRNNVGFAAGDNRRERMKEQRINIRRAA